MNDQAYDPHCGLDLAHCFHRKAEYQAERIKPGIDLKQLDQDFYLRSFPKSFVRREPKDSHLQGQFQALGWLGSVVRETLTKG